MIINSIRDKINNEEKFNEIKKRYLERNIEEISLKNIFSTNLDVIIPIEYLMTEYNKNISNYGLVLYNEYPLLSPGNPGNKNFSDHVISLKFFDNSTNEIPIKDLKIPIDFYIHKPQKDFSNCVFLNTNVQRWDNKGCIAEDLGDVLLCSCNHLTDFSLAKYNPVAIFKDVIFLIMDMWIINEFDSFKYLNYKNAIAVYIFWSIMVIFLIGLIPALKHDSISDKDKFVHIVEKKYEICSPSQTYDELYELREITDESEIHAFCKIVEKLENNCNINQDEVTFERSNSYTGNLYKFQF